MSNIQYHSQVPENNNPEGFTEFQNLDWVVQVNGRKLLRNSVRVVGEVVIDTDGGDTAMGVGDEIAVDHKVGHHSWFQSWTCESPKGLIEQLNEYPRYNNMITSATHSKYDFFSAKANAEGKNPCADGGRVVIQPVASNNNTTGGLTNFATDPSFAIQPLICFNRMLGGDWSFNRMGYIRVSTILARNGACLHGNDMAQGSKYTLKNVRLEYQTIPDDGKDSAILAHSYVNIKSTINSRQHNLSAKVPASACNGVVVSYLEQARENDLKHNTLELQQFPLPDELSYLFNNSTQKYLTYNISDRRDMVARGLEALGNGEGSHSQVSGDSLSSNSGYLTGLAFDEYVSLENQKFNIQTKSSDTALNQSPFVQYCYFLTLVKLA
jgi:hypothetical protein